jgi:hypothetical protein
MVELKDSCVKAARGPIVPQSVPGENNTITAVEVKTVSVRVGQQAPDFEANAFVADQGFVPIRLSNYKGKWVVVCFYPGDFTFV